MSPEISTNSPQPTSPFDKIELKPLTANQKDLAKELVKHLISPGIKYVLATKLNNLTGKKIKCLRNWQANSGHALFQKIKEGLAPTVRKKIKQASPGVIKALDDIPNTGKEWIVSKAPNILKGLTNTAVEWGAEQIGLKESVKICKNFIGITRDLLLQTGEDNQILLLQPGGDNQVKTMDRLLTIVGAAYSGNTNVQKIVDSTLGALSDGFFTELLPKILNERCGKFAGVAKKLVTTLGVKGIVDNFLKETVLQDQNVAKVLDKGDVYQKLILKGVSIFVENKDKDVKNLSLDDLLKDKNLEKYLKEQLQELQATYNNSKLTRVSLAIEQSFIPHVLEELAKEGEGNILSMKPDTLKSILTKAGKSYLTSVTKDGPEKVKAATTATIVNTAKAIENTAKAIGNTLCEGLRKVKECATNLLSLNKTSKIEAELEEDLEEYIQNLSNEKKDATSSSKPVERKAGEGSSTYDVVMDKTTDALATGVKALGRGVEAAAPAIEAVGNGLLWVGGKAVSLGRQIFGSSSKEENKTPSTEAKEVTTTPEKATEVPVSEQQSLPKETKMEEAVVQPNVIADTKQATPTIEGKKPEETAPGAEAKSEEASSTGTTKEIPAAEIAEDTSKTISEQQNLPKETKVEEAVVQPNVIADTEQATPTIENKKPEEAAPITENKETPNVVNYSIDAEGESDALSAFWEGAKIVGNGAWNAGKATYNYFFGGASSSQEPAETKSEEASSPGTTKEVPAAEIAEDTPKTEDKASGSSWWNPFSWRR